jgi:TPR repeat protein
MRIVPSGAATANVAPAAPPWQSAEPAFASSAVAKAISRQSDEKTVRASPPAMSAQLTVKAVLPQKADEPARLAISAVDAGANAAVVIDGLAPGSTLSSGAQAGPNAWRLSVEELAGAAVTPPRGFVGPMDLTLELRLADNAVVDRKNLHLEWLGKTTLAPAKSQPRQHDAAEITLMMKNGAELMSNGDIAAARMMYRRAAEAGEAAAAFALAETYDPVVLSKLNAKGGITPDVALAQSWYEKAKDLGYAVASERLDRLVRLPD